MTTTTLHREMLSMEPVSFDHEEILGLLESVSDFRNIWQARSKQDDAELKASFATGIVPELIGDILVVKVEGGRYELLDGLGRIQQAVTGGFTHLLGFREVTGSDQQIYDLSTKVHGIRRRIKEVLRSWHVVNSHRNNPDMTLALMAKDAGVKELDHMRKVVRAYDAGLYPDVVKGILKAEEAQALAQESNKDLLEKHKAGQAIATTRRALNKARRDREDKKNVDDLKKRGYTDEQIAEFRKSLSKETAKAVTEHGAAEIAALAKVTKEKEALEELVAQLTLACAVMSRTLEDAGDDVGERLRLAREFSSTPDGQTWMVQAEARTQAIMAQWSKDAKSSNTNTAPATVPAVPVTVITDKAEHTEKKKEWEDGYRAWFVENIGPWVTGADSKERSRRSKAREQYRNLFGPELVYLAPNATDES